MTPKNLNSIYFLGIGGIGMSALARYYRAQGVKVYGYDKTSTELTRQLEQEGIEIHYEEKVELLEQLFESATDNWLVCYTPAIPKDNQEFLFFQERGINLYKRSEVLGLITQNYFTIAVAGTHGKTTTSSMVAHILNECGVNCLAFLGGISVNFNSNLLLNDQADTIVVEADEYDRSFLTLSPDIALVTSLDADHLDIYGDSDHMQKAYRDFVGKIKPGGTLITKAQYADTLNNRQDIYYKTYSLTDQADTHAMHLQVAGGAYVADVQSNNSSVKDVEIGLPGIHNVENAMGAFAIAKALGLDENAIKAALKSYRGVKRRFEYHIKTPDLVYIDDYAHHPSELNMCIRSVRELYPNKKIIGVFQPHLYSRTRDFAIGFAESLSLLDELILLDIYPARELPIPGVNSEMIAAMVTIPEKVVLGKGELIGCLRDKHLEVLLTVGAGDIDTLIQPIKNLLSEHA
ncbi:MAG: UDP-N-acetylmuramate--L-alanine ligase [Flavobacteriales bacterium]|nr:UDP-N-acetylmuramate--L-alanine ligase [Flavobacteriales bacterium]